MTAALSLSLAWFDAVPALDYAVGVCLLAGLVLLVAAALYGEDVRRARAELETRRAAWDWDGQHYRRTSSSRSSTNDDGPTTGRLP